MITSWPRWVRRYSQSETFRTYPNCQNGLLQWGRSNNEPSPIGCKKTPEGLVHASLSSRKIHGIVWTSCIRKHWWSLSQSSFSYQRLYFLRYHCITNFQTCPPWVFSERSQGSIFRLRVDQGANLEAGPGRLGSSRDRQRFSPVLFGKTRIGTGMNH